VDILPVQEIINQQTPIQEPEIASAFDMQHPQKKGILRKLLDLATWIILFALLPITVLIFLSQNSIPGDFFYPVKRGMEDIILQVASVSPVARAAFKTNLTEARFNEAQSLVISKSNASGLSSFVDEIKSTQVEVANLKNDKERKKAEEKLLTKIDQYQNGLSNLQTKTENNIATFKSQNSLPTVAPTISEIMPTKAQTSKNFPSLTPTPTRKPVLSRIPTLLPTSIPTSSPTLAPISTVIPTQFVAREDDQAQGQEEIADEIKNAKEELDKIKKDLEKKKDEHQNSQNQNDQKQNEKNEDNHQNKENSDKKSDSSDHQKKEESH
jgi:Skp family chaperone for outer membrane proteins